MSKLPASVKQAADQFDDLLSPDVLKGTAYGKADELAEAGRQFVTEVSRLPGGTAELTRRRLLVAEQTKTDTPFHAALRAVLPSLRRVPANGGVTPLEAIEILRNALWQWGWTENEGRCPEQIADVRRVYQAAQHLVSVGGCSIDSKRRLEALRDEADRVLADANRDCVEGMAWLMDHNLPEFLRVQAMAAVILPAVKASVRSLSDWVVNSEAARPHEQHPPHQAAEPTSAPTSGTASDTLTKEEKALATLVAHPGWTDKQIAEHVGCHRTSLYRWPKFVAAREALETGREQIPKADQR